MSQQINLYDARLRPQHELATARNLGICALVLLAVMTAFSLRVGFEAKQQTQLASVSQKQMVETQEKLASLSKMVAQREVSPTLKSELDIAKTMLSARTEALEVLESGKIGNTSGFSAFMSGFARQTQAGLWLTGFSVSAGGEEIEIRGRLLDPAKLPGYVQHLSAEPVFQGRRFAALEMRGVDPDEQKPDQPGVPKAAGTVSSPATVKMPRFAEFALRSDNLPEGVKP